MSANGELHENGGRASAPLDDIRVLDLSRFLSGPYATSVLADLGADVVKIARPGESKRSDGPLSREEAFDWATNRGKRSIELDLRSDAGRESFLGLVSRADVVIDNFRPGTLERLGLGYERLRDANPRIIACDISGWGPTGPWAQVASYDLIAQAASGSIDVTGPHEPAGEAPCRWGVPIGDIAASLFATIGILAALAIRDRDGIGQRVSVSMLDCLLALSTYRVPQIFDAGLPVRMDPHKGGAGTTPYGPYLCSDGRWIAIGFAQPHWRAACTAMDRPDLIDDPRFDSEFTRNRHAGELDILMAEILRRRPSTEWQDVFIAAGAPAGKVNTLEEAFTHPQADARGMIATIVDRQGRVAHVAADPMGIQTGTRPPIELDDPAEITWDVRPGAVADASAERRAPLDGTRIIEMDGNEPSKTLATQILADLGADVLLIERPEPVRPRDPDAAPDAFMLTDAFRWGMHRGKRGIVLNLKDEAGKSAFNDLLKEADAVYDNYRPGVKARLGVSRDELTAQRPGLVTCSATGFGATGPWAQAPAYDVTLQALSGAMSITGNGRDGDPPVRFGHPVGGLAGGLYGAIAVLASLRDVRRGRPARHVDLSLFDIQIALHSYRVPQTLDVGMTFHPEPRAGGSGARPYGVYPTSDERWFAAGITDQFWLPFCKAAGLQELVEDPRFATGPDRTANADALEEIVEARFRSRTGAEWDQVFLEHGLPGSRVLTLEEAFRHPQAQIDGMLREIPTARGRVVHVSGFPVLMSESKLGNWSVPPGW
jgi:crotonobetainyl-CoA:carnitine CoA-transferase CaiB-like acyl-CoA transferase